MPTGHPRTCRTARGALALLAGLALVACSDGGDDGAPAPADSSPATLLEGPVAATAVVPGDCLNGIVLGAAERAEITSAQVVSCDRAHAVEVFDTFTLAPGDFELDTAEEYPGVARVVQAADAGCRDRIGRLVDEPDAFGLIAMWPSQASWRTGDRAVACAVFSPDGGSFEGRQL